MKYRKVGRSGLIVSELCLGTNMFGGANLEFWKTLGGLDQQAVNTVVSTAVDGGVNFFDTADGYSLGQSETLLGQSIKDLNLDRSQVVICTKGGFPMGPTPNNRGNSRAHLTTACENSLRRLGTDYIDLYQMHTFDPATPLEESMRALNDLVQSGKVRYIGCSNFDAWEVVKANAIAEREGLARLEIVETQWSVATRDIERDILPMAKSEGVGIMTWGALLSGVLTGKYHRDGSTADAGHRGGGVHPLLDRNKVFDIVDLLRDIGDAHAVTPAEIALAFLLHNKAATSVIFGSTKAEQVKANLRASDIVLADDEYQRLHEMSKITPNYVHLITGGARTDREPYLS